uniref:Uncharacterized protein n=1 Tax=Anguilla anguilla TaxID=7936 RepID=A0A0E9RE86_ANGAN
MVKDLPRISSTQISQLISLIGSTSWLKNCANLQIQVIGTKHWGGLLTSELGFSTSGCSSR